MSEIVVIFIGMHQEWLNLYQCVGPTFFRGPLNFKLSHGICLFPQNFDIFA